MLARITSAVAALQEALDSGDPATIVATADAVATLMGAAADEDMRRWTAAPGDVGALTAGVDRLTVRVKDLTQAAADRLAVLEQLGVGGAARTYGPSGSRLR